MILFIYGKLQKTPPLHGHMYVLFLILINVLNFEFSFENSLTILPITKS